MNLGQARDYDDASPGQRARRHELQAYCKRKNIPVAGDATKDEILKILDVTPLIPIETAKRVKSDPDLGSHSETNDEKRARLTAELAALDGPKIFSTKILNPQRTPADDVWVKLDQMQHHERKKWLVAECERKGVECRFPGKRGKGPEVLEECKRVAAM